MYRYVKPKVNAKLREGMNPNYGKNGEVKVNKGKVHKYLGMTADFTEKGKLKINMNDYVERIINDFSMKISRTDTDLTSARNNIFEKLSERGWLKKKPKSYIIQSNRNVFGQEIDTGYSPTGHGVDNKG